MIWEKDGCCGKEKPMNRKMFTLLAFALLLVFSPVCRAETYIVSPDGMTLTEALALCADGDVIDLADGVYSEPGEVFPLTVQKAITLRAAEGASPVIDAPALEAALRVEADHVAFQGLDIRFRRTGIYAIGNDMTVENCRITLADPAWRTSSCGMWCGGVYRVTLRDCAFTGCGVSLAGPPLSESSAGKPVLTGLFEVGEELEYFTTHTMENCTVNGKPLFYAVSLPEVSAPEGMGEIVCCGCGKVTVKNADVSDCSMGMELVYNDWIDIENCSADRCGVFGIYAAKCGGGTLNRCSAEQTNHGLDVRACQQITLLNCAAVNCEQGLFFSKVNDSAMIGCAVTGTGQGYFMAGGEGNILLNCAAVACENGFRLEKEESVLMTGCTAEKCTVCGARLFASPAAFVHNTLRENWTAVMAYGGVSFDIADNLFENNACCGLYLRDIAFSRIAGNTFTGSGQISVQAVGVVNGSLWLENALDLPADFSGVSDGFGLME